MYEKYCVHLYGSLHVFLTSVWASTVRRNAVLVTDWLICVNVNDCVSYRMYSIVCTGYVSRCPLPLAQCELGWFPASNTFSGSGMDG